MINVWIIKVNECPPSLCQKFHERPRFNNVRGVPKCLLHLIFMIMLVFRASSLAKDRTLHHPVLHIVPQTLSANPDLEIWDSYLHVRCMWMCSPTNTSVLTPQCWIGSLEILQTVSSSGRHSFQSRETNQHLLTCSLKHACAAYGCFLAPFSLLSLVNEEALQFVPSFNRNFEPQFLTKQEIFRLRFWAGFLKIVLPAKKETGSGEVDTSHRMGLWMQLFKIIINQMVWCLQKSIFNQ